jgi:hypothetical protein
MLTTLAAVLRRAVGLHGNAVANAADIAAYPNETPTRDTERAAP